MTSATLSETQLQPLGAHVDADGVSYCVWAPDQSNVLALIERKGTTTELALERDEQGFWRGRDPYGRAGDLYQFRLDGNRRLPDMASRFQPQGVHGPSECIDPTKYRWRANWTRPAWRGQTSYELHIGTFTPEGTFRAAIKKLDHLCELGVDAIELMPVGDFAGDRNWGYDGVSLYAPARCYGRPDDLRALVDAAHARGLAVILDVVYNHLGPSGNYLAAYSTDYFNPSRTTPWGPALHLDGPNSAPVRAFLVGNAAYWFDEYRIDGLRLDATHAIPDESRPHLLEEITAAVHARGGFVIAEDERNSSELLRTAEGKGYDLDAAWSDDFHHQVRVALTGKRRGYFSSYGGTAAEVADVLAHGWTYRGQPFSFWQNKPRGGPCDHLPAKAFVLCIENHDQVGNRAKGERLEHLISPEQFRAATMLLCLSPYAPMLFMGQEWAASSPFQFFTDHEGELGRQVSAGRKREFAQSGLNHDGDDVPDPQALSTFTDSKLDWAERDQSSHASVLALHRAVLRERRTWLSGAVLDRGRWQVHSAGDWIAVRYTLPEGDRMLLVALNSAVPLGVEWPEAFRPPEGTGWHVVLHSNEPEFGGAAPTAIEAGELTGPGAAWLVALEDEPDGDC